MSTRATTTPRVTVDESTAVASALGAWRDLREISGEGSHISLTLDEWDDRREARLHIGGTVESVLRALRACDGVTVTHYAPTPGEYSVRATFRGLPVTWHCFAPNAEALLAAFPVAGSVLAGARP